MARKRKPPEDEPMPPAVPVSDRSGSRHKSRKMVAIDPERYELLKRTAKQDSRPTSWQLRHILDEFFRSRGIQPPVDQEEPEESE